MIHRSCASARRLRGAALVVLRRLEAEAVLFDHHHSSEDKINVIRDTLGGKRGK